MNDPYVSLDDSDLHLTVTWCEGLIVKTLHNKKTGVTTFLSIKESPFKFEGPPLTRHSPTPPRTSDDPSGSDPSA